MKQNVPFAPQQYFDDNGLPNDSGYIWVYYKGTSTPATAAIFFDLDGNVPGSNPIVLDGAGKPEATGAWYIEQGAYTLVLHGSDDVQIGQPVDIIASGSIFGGGNEIVNQGAAIIVKTYADVRGITGDWDVVYCCGRSNDGDGGQGWFQWLPTDTGADDDGICLVAGSKRYVRVLDAGIDPRWYGLAYNSNVNQVPTLLQVLAATDRWSLPAFIEGQVYIAQNMTVTARQSINVLGTGIFVSATGMPVTMTFTGLSEFTGVGLCFGAEVQPIFTRDTVDYVRLSWMGGATNEDKLAKLAACSSVDQAVLIDESFTVATFPTMPANIHLDVAGGLITINSPSNFSADVIYTGYDQFIAYTSKSNILNVYVGKRQARPEWFGAVGDNTTDDSIGLQAAIKTERVALRDGASYRAAQQLNCPVVTSFYGNLVAAMSVNAPISDVSSVPTPKIFLDPPSSLDTLHFNLPGQLALVNVGLALGGNAAVETNTGTINAVGSVIFATNATGTLKSNHVALSSTVINNVTALTAPEVNQAFDNVRDDAAYDKRKFSHNSSFREVYLQNEAGESATYDNVLTTRNADGLVEGKHTLHLQSVTFDTTVVTNPDYTLIEVIGEFNLDHTSVRVKRDGVQIAFYDATPAYVVYDVRADDKPMIVMQPKGYGIGPIWTYVKPANLPSGAKVAEVVHAGSGSTVVRIGDIGGSAFCWNPGYVTLLDTSIVEGANHRVAQLRNVLGKWSIG